MVDSAEANARFSEVMWLRALLGLSTTARQVQTYREAASAGKIMVFHNNRHTPVAYMIWAGVARESALRFASQGATPAYSYEWSEGRICLVIEVRVCLWHWQWVGRRLRNFFRSQRAVIFARREHSYTYLRHARKWVRKVETGAPAPVVSRDSAAAS